MKSYKSVRRIYLAMAITWIILVILTLLYIGTAAADEGEAATISTNCEIGETCYFLMDQTSMAYMLCNNGRIDITIYGNNSIKIDCVENSDLLPPIPDPERMR